MIIRGIQLKGFSYFYFSLSENKATQGVILLSFSYYKIGESIGGFLKLSSYFKEEKMDKMPEEANIDSVMFNPCNNSCWPLVFKFPSNNAYPK